MLLRAAAFAATLTRALAEHADFTQGRDSVEIFAGHAHEAHRRNKCVNLVDDDALATAQETTDFGVVPAERCLYFVTFGAMQRMAQRGFDEGGRLHDSTPGKRT
ncbi:hypothetical protein WK01_36020 [Burkholderia cepacia]|nr:hypothetical protein WK01_36020 [Burkholderia cepacia]